MTILVTGNLGYIGTVLTEILIEKSYKVVGYDIDFYDGCNIFSFKKPQKQIIKDIRDVGIKDLRNIDSIIHLAALSNDPVGELSPHLTDDINLHGTLKLAKLAKKAGIKRFVYASSQSMYGISTTKEELDEDDGQKNPLTAYARTKWDAEQALKKMSSDNFIVTCFRPSTVFGASPRIRLDIVFNNFVSCAYTTGKIEIMSDGLPWRPVVHVRDVSSALIAGIEAPESLVSNQSFNVGIPEGNFSVKELAEAAQRSVPGSELKFLGAHSDSRTYRISFSKILSKLKDFYKPQWNLDNGGTELVDLFKRIGFTENDFRGNKFIRLNQLNYLMRNNLLSKDLRYNGRNSN